MEWTKKSMGNNCIFVQRQASQDLNPSSTVHQVGGSGHTANPLHMHRHNYDTRKTLKRAARAATNTLNIQWKELWCPTGRRPQKEESWDFKVPGPQKPDRSPASQGGARRREQKDKGCRESPQVDK